MKKQWIEALRNRDESLIVSDEEVERAFLGTNFGSDDFRSILNQAVLKKMMHYHCGHTITVIMKDLKLIGKTEKPTLKGINLVRVAYGDLVRG